LSNVRKRKKEVRKRYKQLLTESEEVKEIRKLYYYTKKWGFKILVSLTVFVQLMRWSFSGFCLSSILKRPTTKIRLLM